MHRGALLLTSLDFGGLPGINGRAIRTHAAQPLLEHDKAEEQLVIVLPTGSMFVEEFFHRLGFQQIEHQRVSIE